MDKRVFFNTRDESIACVLCRSDLTDSGIYIKEGGEMMSSFDFGEIVEGYEVNVLNEREVARITLHFIRVTLLRLSNLQRFIRL